MYKKLFLVLFSLTVFSGFFYAKNTSAVTSSATWPINFECRGCSDDGQYAALLPDYNNFQAWKARIYASVEGHGSGARYGIMMCLSPNGAMYGGNPCWAIVDRNTGGIVNDGHGTVNQERDIGADPSPDLSYAVVDLHADDVTFENPGSTEDTRVVVEGRQVSMTGPTASTGSANVGVPFTVSWSTNEVLNGPSDVVFSYTGSVSCNLASPTGLSGNGGGSATCTGSGVGTATFTVEATGYNGRVGPRPKTISASTNVTITNPGSDITFNVTDACSGGNIAGNATITLTGVGTQVTTDAGAYNTTTFLSAASGIRTYTSVVPGYTNTPGTVNVNSSKTVAFAQARPCGGPWSTFTASSPFGYTNSVGPLTVGYGTNSTTLTWTSNAGSCNVTSNPNVGSWSGANGTNVNVGVLTANTTFTLTCNNGAAVRNLVVNIPPTPTGIIASCPSPGNLATINWNTSGGYDTFYFRALNGFVGDTGAYIPNSNENHKSTTGTVLTVAGNPYSVYVYTRAVNDAWSNFVGVQFTCGNLPPTMTSVTIDSPSVLANSSNTYTITMTASEPSGGSNIWLEYALINYGDGLNPVTQNEGSYRGFITWGINDYWPTPGEKDHTACYTSGGVPAGYVIIQSLAPTYSIFGHDYIEIDQSPGSCIVTTSGLSRSVAVRVMFNPLFVTNGPLTNNDISGYVTNSLGISALSGWANFDTDFSINNGLPPTASLTANGAIGVTVVPGDTINYLWSSTNGTSWVTDLQIYNSSGNPVASDPCGNVSTSNWAPVSTANGSSPGHVVGACQLGYRYRFTYEVSGPVTPLAQSVLNITVTSNPVNGVCGSADQDYTIGVTSYGTDTFCAVGNSSPATPAFPPPGGSTSWQCLGANGGLPVSCTATVADTAYSVSVLVLTDAGGTVTSMPSGINCGGTCSTSFPYGSLVTLVATPSSSYWKFTEWLGDCTGTGACILTVDSAKVVLARFSPRLFRYVEF